MKALKLRSSQAPAGYDIMIRASRALNLNANARADAGVADGKALLEIKFESKECIVFSAPDAKVTQATDLRTLGYHLNERRLQNQWNMAHAVVVQVTTVSRATVLVSDEDNAHVNFEIAANAPLNAQAMADLDVGTSLLSSRGVGMRIIGVGPLTPLFRLAYLRTRWFRDPEIVYRDARENERTVGQRLEEYDVDDEHVLAMY